MPLPLKKAKPEITNSVIRVATIAEGEMQPRRFLFIKTPWHQAALRKTSRAQA
jgi:hypothetical protein